MADGKVNLQEAKFLAAMAVNVELEDVTRFLVIVKGKCKDCGGDDAYSMATNIETVGEWQAITDDALATAMNGDT